MTEKAWLLVVLLLPPPATDGLITGWTKVHTEQHRCQIERIEVLVKFKLMGEARSMIVADCQEMKR